MPQPHESLFAAIDHPPSCRSSAPKRAEMTYTEMASALDQTVIETLQMVRTCSSRLQDHRARFPSDSAEVAVARADLRRARIEARHFGEMRAWYRSQSHAKPDALVPYAQTPGEAFRPEVPTKKAQPVEVDDAIPF